jgi:hypothetical protein
VRSATGAHNHRLVGAPDQGAGSSGPETESLAVGRPLGSIQQYPLNITAEGQQVNISTGVVNATVDNSLYSGDNLVVYQVNKVLLPPALFGSSSAHLAQEEGEDAGDVSPDAIASLAAARVAGGGVAAAVLALACVWWGL